MSGDFWQEEVKRIKGKEVRVRKVSAYGRPALYAWSGYVRGGRKLNCSYWMAIVDGKPFTGLSRKTAVRSARAYLEGGA